MTVEKNRRILLRSRPVGLPKSSDYEMVEEEVPEPGPGQIVIRNKFISLDPAIRGWMDESEDSYLPPIKLGEAVKAVTVGEVVKTANPAYAEGDLVMGIHGWEDYSVSQGESQSTKIAADTGVSPSLFLGVLGSTGLTAYFGLLDVGRPNAGEVVLVSGAAGAVGSIVGQIAKIKGCKAYGIAGSKKKIRWITEELGFDGAINYKTCGDMTEAIRAMCPDGVDIYFDNVGGEILDAALMNLRERARIVMCGAISTYNVKEPQPGPYNLWQLLVKSARIEGFLIRNYADRFPEGAVQMAEWINQGRIKYKEEIIDGLENAPDAFLKLFTGENEGKLVIRP
ncbi:MAG: NADP-dependent oxidoreductase [Alphaproteobacteria bacterium]|nr:MAG: NADP-dependent oxidoreductase [Alphaproteobacteria bacterium]